MPTYKQRVTADLDRWIAAGLAPPANRAAILASIPDGRRLDAAQTLAWVGAVLAGVALIAFIAANWPALPRLAQFGVVLGVYGAAAGGAAWCLAHGRPGAANGLLAFAALAFAAAIGLTGQIFDIVGDERTALYAAGLAAAALALAGRASGPAILALGFVALGDFAARGLLDSAAADDLAWLFVAAPAGAALAVRWRSVPLAHGAAVAALAAAIWLALRLDAHAATQLAVAGALAAAAALARWLRERGRTGAGVLYGWLAWAAMGFFMVSGWELKDALAIAHRLAWLLLGGGLLALGRHDRMAAVTALGVLSLMLGVSVLMYDLGLGLMTASAVFFAAAVIAVAAGLALRRRAAA
jgi:uncharacterized membrane protein